MKSFLQNSILFLVASAIGIGGIELGLRIWSAELLAMGSSYVFHRFDPVLGWDNLANAQGQFSRLEFSYHVKINSSGMWDDEIKPKAPGEFRVAVLGDSFTWGVGTPYGERFTEVMEARDRRIERSQFRCARLFTNPDTCCSSIASSNTSRTTLSSRIARTTYSIT